jgi:hypothetical protein
MMATQQRSSSPVSLEPQEIGQCKVLPYLAQIEAVHMALLHTGKVLFFSGFRVPEAVPCETRLWYPKTGELKAVPTPVNLICTGHSFLPDGRLLATGGTLEYRNAPASPFLVRLTRPLAPIIVKFGDLLSRVFRRDLPVLTGPTFTYLFNPTKEQWEFSGDMEAGRWYPTNTTLPDGRILILSGTDEGGGVGKKDPVKLNTRVETFSATEGVRQVATLPEEVPEHLGSAHEDHGFLSVYPRMHVLPLSEADREVYPDGKLFCSGYGPETRFLNVKTWEWTDVAKLKFAPRHDGCAVLLPLRPPDYHAKVLALGGVTDEVSGVATDSVELIDFSQTPHAWQEVAHMHYKRVNTCGVILPDGRLVVVGGNSLVQFDQPVYDIEVFDPDTGTWALAARMKVPRGYHSTALLLPDGRVLMCGSTPYGNYELRMEVYWPSYLFKEPRPRIASVPEKTISYGGIFTVNYTYPGAITSAALIRPGATTHAFDMNQRYVELKIASVSTDQVTLEAPPDEHIAPPGYYMLFLLGEQNLPSEAVFINLPNRSQLPKIRPNKKPSHRKGAS